MLLVSVLVAMAVGGIQWACCSHLRHRLPYKRYDDLVVATVDD